MEFKISGELLADEKLIREEVFMSEQGFKNEFDETDGKAFHLVMYDNNIPVAAAASSPGIMKGNIY